jgi:hypothetical protein
MLTNVNWRKIGAIALVAFIIFFVVRSPVESADVVKTVASAIASFANDAAVSMTTFLRTLF